MRISAVAIEGSRGRPDLQIDTLDAGLNVFFGPVHSGKTTLAELVAHVLYGCQPKGASAAERAVLPAGHVIVESGDRRYRLRRHPSGASAGGLTVASLDGSPVDQLTVRAMLHGLAPRVAARLYATSFHEPPELDALLAAGSAEDLLPSTTGSVAEYAPNRAAILARREALAHDLEQRISAARQASRQLRDRWSELDRIVRERQQELSNLRDRLRAIDTALAETDARLRYRRLETSIDHGAPVDPTDCRPQLAELDEQIDHWRAVLADLDRRHAQVRGEIVQIAPQAGTLATPAAGRVWLAIARQLATDLEGEVARLARASSSHECVCDDAHPRLRPIVEMLLRQLDALERLLGAEQRASQAAELEQEADDLARSQAELRRQLDHLLSRRGRLVRHVDPDLLPGANDGPSGNAPDAPCFTTADTEQLELRRSELEHERYELCGRITDLEPELSDLCRQRDTIDRERATLLSDRAVIQVQEELAAVERELEVAMSSSAHRSAIAEIGDDLDRVSEFLAQLTNGDLVRAELSADRRTVRVVNRAGEAVPCASLSRAQRDQLYLSVCLAIVSAYECRGARLPLVLDEPFLRLDQHDTAALAAVLNDFARRGSQVLLFTGQRTAIERFKSLSVRLHDMRSLRHERSAA